MSKKVEALDIPAVGGYRDEYWEIGMGDKTIKIQKPKDPVADLQAMESDRSNISVEKEKKELHKAMRKSFRVENERET